MNKYAIIRLYSTLLAGVLVTGLLTGNAYATLITFESLVIDRLDQAGIQSEGPFQYEATIGDGWELSDRNTTSNSHLSTFVDLEPSEVGDIVEFTRTNDGLFSFNSVDFATAGTANSDDVRFTGFNNGVIVDLFVITNSTASRSVFETVVFDFGAPIDLLQVQVVGNTGSNGMRLDNIDLTLVADAIPEPTTLALFGIGLAGLAGMRRRQRRKTA